MINLAIVKSKQILLIASDLLGESLALQLNDANPDIEVILKADQIKTRPSLVIWVLEGIEILNAIELELQRLQEHWKPSPVLLVLPSKVRLKEEELLFLDCAGLLQSPDISTLQEAISTLIAGGRVVRLISDPIDHRIYSQPPIGLGQWLLISGLQQINNDLQKLRSLLNPPPENLFLEVLLKGRRREMMGAKSLLVWLWGPLQSNLDPAESISQTKSHFKLDKKVVKHEQLDIHNTSIVLKERNPKAVWEVIRNRLNEKINNGLNNGTGGLLAIEGLKQEKRRDLLISLISQLDNVIRRLQVSSDSNISPNDCWESLHFELREQALRNMAGNYIRLPRRGKLEPVAEHLIKVTELSQKDDDMPDQMRVLDPLIIDRPVIVSGQLLPADNPRALIQLELLIGNWLIRTAELISAEAIGACGEWPELRRYLLVEDLIPTRELERLRNQLNSQTSWRNLIQRPIELYESKRLLFTLKDGNINMLYQTEPRDEELQSLGWAQQQVVLLMEARDALAPQMQALLKRIGDLMVILLTKVIGRSIGLVGRGIAQGMGRSIGRGTS